MFYVSDVNGVLRPLDQLPAGPYGVRPVDAAAATAVVASTASVAAADEVAATTQTVSVNASDAAVEDAVVVSLHTDFAEIPLTTTVAAGAMGLAAAAYRAAEMPHEQSQQPLHAGRIVESVDRVEPIERDVPQHSQTKQYFLHQRDTLPNHDNALLTAADVMSSPVVSLPITATVAEVFRVFAERRFRHVPILLNGGPLVGILSDRDLFRLAVKESAVPQPFAAFEALTVEKIMVSNVLTARPQASIRVIGEVMFEQRIGAMPIVDVNGELVGMLTRSDILRAAIHHLPVEQWS